MKKILLFLLGITIFVPSVTEALEVKDDAVSNKDETVTLSYEDFNVECLYDSGITLSISGRTVSGKNYFSIDFKTTPINGGITLPFSLGTRHFYNEAEVAKKAMDSFTCPNSLAVGSFHHGKWEDCDNGCKKAESSFEIYFVSTDISDWIGAGDDNAWDWARKDGKIPGFTGIDPGQGGWDSFDIESDDILYTRLTRGLPASKEKAFYLYLVSERIKLNSTEETESWAFKTEGKQAASTAEYVKLMRYKSPNGSLRYLLEKGNTVTVVSSNMYMYGDYSNSPSDFINAQNASNDQYKRYVCINISTDSVSDDTHGGFNYSNIRHTMLGSSRDENNLQKTAGDAYVIRTNYEYVFREKPDDARKIKLDHLVDKTGIDVKRRVCKTEGYAFYEETALDEYQGDSSAGTSICDVIPNTAVWLVLAINWLQIIVPILLIVLTGLDISKIVISGNLDEELPKRRKLMIVRGVVAIIFFFIPVILKVVINKNYGIDFGDVSCLFDGSVDTSKAEEDLFD